MSEIKKSSKLKITYPVVFFTVLALHVLGLGFRALPDFNFNLKKNEERTVLHIRRVKTPRIDQPFATNVNLPIRDLKSRFSPHSQKDQVSFKDLAVMKSLAAEKIPRPGSRPDVGLKKMNSIKQLSIRDQAFKDFTQSNPTGLANMSSIDTGSFKISDAAIGIENPDGVEPDELNQNELVYYGFQKRMLVGYINAIVNEIGKFQRKHRNYQLGPNTKILMTARLTYDSEGNVKQIKMIRWSQLDPIQGIFEESMKNMNRLNNPPKDLGQEWRI